MRALPQETVPLLTGRGERSRYLGANRSFSDQVTLFATNRQTDTLFTDIRNRRVVERLLRDPRRGPSAEAKAIVRGYVAGINRYLRSVGGSAGIADRSCRGAAWLFSQERWVDFAFTPRQIERSLLRSYRVSGRS